MKVFVCPLDWGLGHAARCVPLINYLLEKKVEVIIGAEGLHLAFLKEHFPDVKYIEFPGYRISYSGYLSAGLKTLLQIPKMVAAIKKEHRLLDRLIKEEKIDAVISDNRYGLWNKKISCIIVSHQLNIQAAAGSRFFSKIVCNYIRHFDECWIPDYEGAENLSGLLSHPIPAGINGKYIGPLSRFEREKKPKPETKKYDLLAIFSGPEAQRSKLEKIILEELKWLPELKAFIIEGLPGKKAEQSVLKNVEIAPHLPDAELEDKINCSEVVLSRPGYSTLMDLQAMGWKQAIFIATPGQTEQTYLGKHAQEKRMCVTCKQRNFSLKDALEKLKQMKAPEPVYEERNFKSAVDAWINKIA